MFLLYPQVLYMERYHTDLLVNIKKTKNHKAQPAEI